MLLIHCEDDQVVPIAIASKKSAKLIKDVKEIYYPGGPHEITATQPDRINADLLDFIKHPGSLLKPLESVRAEVAEWAREEHSALLANPAPLLRR